MNFIGTFNYKFRIIYSLIGFLLLHLTLLPAFLIQFIGAPKSSISISEILTAPGYLIPGKNSITMLLIMFFLGSAGYLLGYVQDRLRVSKVKTVKRSRNDKKTKNPYIKKIVKSPRNQENKRGRPVENLLRISNRLFIIFITGAVLFSTFIPDLWQSSVAGCRSPCSELVIDAQNTLAALASYFSEPEHTRIPTVEDLIRTEYLTLHKNSTVIIDGSADTTVRVSVIDNKKKCPRGNIYEVYMGGHASEWYTVKKIDPHDPKLRPLIFFD